MTVDLGEIQQVRVVTTSGYGEWWPYDLAPGEQVLDVKAWLDGAQHYMRLVIQGPAESGRNKQVDDE